MACSSIGGKVKRDQARDCELKAIVWLQAVFFGRERQTAVTLAGKRCWDSSSSLESRDHYRSLIIYFRGNT
jgi:hypothetical protein